MTRTTYMENLGKIQFQWSPFNDLALNTFYFTSTGVNGASESSLAAMAEAIVSSPEGSWAATISHDVILENCLVFDWSSADGLVGSHSGWTGTDTSSPVSGQVAGLINWQEAFRYRGGHPRTYIPGIGADWLATTTTWNPDIVSQLAAGGSALMVEVNGYSLNDAACTFVVYHDRMTSGKPDYTPVTPFTTPLSGVTASNVPATIRRRVRRAGHRR
jgi:hypothetical protein